MHYTLRLQFGPHHPSGRIREELDMGHEPLEEVRTWLEAIRPWKKALEGMGFSVSLNPWHTILPGQPWQTMVDWRGRPASAVVCPLGPGAYYDEVLRLCAREGFRIIWIDDDIRLHNHAPLDWGGCFCPLHLAGRAWRP